MIRWASLGKTYKIRGKWLRLKPDEKLVFYRQAEEQLVKWGGGRATM